MYNCIWFLATSSASNRTIYRPILLLSCSSVRALLSWRHKWMLKICLAFLTKRYVRVHNRFNCHLLQHSLKIWIRDEAFKLYCWTNESAKLTKFCDHAIGVLSSIPVEWNLLWNLRPRSLQPPALNLNNPIAGSDQLKISSYIDHHSLKYVVPCVMSFITFRWLHG